MCQRCNVEGYRCELDVDGIVAGQPALQIHQLPVVPTLPRLHHVVDMQRPRLPAVRHDHHTQVGQPEGTRDGTLRYPL